MPDKDISLYLTENQSYEFLNTINHRIMIADADRKIFFANRAAMENFGGMDSLAGKTCYNIIHGSIEPAVQCATCQIRRGGAAACSLADAGQRGKMPVNVFPLGAPAGGILGFLIVIGPSIHPIAAEAGGPDEIKNLYMRGLIHDLNNFLTCISLNIEVACNRCSEDEVLRKMLEDCLHASRQSIHLVGNLLAFSRDGTTQRIIQSRKEVNLEHIIEESASLVFRNSGIEFSMTFELKGKGCVGDELQLCQLFNNLFINAREAISDANGSVSARISGEVLSAGNSSGLNPGNYVRIEVSDNGAGIPAENLKTIFSPFFTTKETGTGLGLSICSWIVKNHGGLITARPGSSSGTVFTVMLPVQQEENNRS
ncbi:MAG TPA: hypothetical protein DCZ94_05985 [Lentisphaeria bacterium]|nr:MAG: hypothetical protein A2X48_07495 [Lentisphaerae bacterium GWF2_49_21]HBC86486.1 hypothetical protein [Lentisphaeria bacterium]